MAASVFWMLLSFVAFALVGFPLSVVGLGALRRRHVAAADITPRVTALIAAYNEASGIEAKLQNLLDQDYPEDQLDIVVIDDGSSDDTAERIRKLENPRIRLEIAPERAGKVAALNRGMQLIDADIVLFSDANAEFEPETVARLVRAFADPDVGGVCGNQLNRRAQGTLGTGESWYWEYDKFLKRMEERAASIVSADGSVYAVRREFVDLVPPGVTDDFFISTGVIAHGARLVYANDARSYEDPLEGGTHHFDRRIRITQQALESLWSRRALLNPGRSGVYAYLLLGHKVLRRLAAPALLALFPAALLASASGDAASQIAALALGAWWIYAALGWWLRDVLPARIFAAPAYVFLGAVATTVGIGRFLLRQRRLTWEPVRD